MHDRSPWQKQPPAEKPLAGWLVVAAYVGAIIGGWTLVSLIAYWLIMVIHWAWRAS